MTDRRARLRYVVENLLLEIGGVEHETIDVSLHGVAAIRQAGIDYKTLKQPFRFKTRDGRIDHPISSLKILHERGATIVFEYSQSCPGWDDVLRCNDVRADVKTLEDMFG